MSKQNQLLKAALEWADKGIPVFACKGDKSPLTKNGFKDATTDPKKVKEMFEFFGEEAQMIGGAMGDGLVGIDVDTYKSQDAIEWLDRGLKEGWIPNSRTHKTGRGGTHILVEDPSGTIKDCKPVNGVEIKVDGGYLILPGSPGYEVVSEGIKEAPKELIRRLTQAKSNQSLMTDDQLLANIATASDFHDSITMLSARLARKNYTVAQVTTTIRDALEGSLGASPHHDRYSRWRNLMADTGGELTRIIKSGFEKYNPDYASNILREGAGLDLDKYSQTAEALGFKSPQDGEQVAEYSDEAWPFTTGYFADEDHDLSEQSFSLYPIFAENETVVLFAEPKTGKTAVALTTALSIACGMDLGAFKVSQAGPTLYYALEGSRAIRLRVAAWRKKKKEEGVELPERIPCYVVEGHANFLKEQARRSEANKIIAANNYAINSGAGALKVVYLDTLTKAMAGGDQNSVEDTSHLFELISLLRAGGVTATIVFVHHKSRQGNARGSTNIEAEPDVLLDVSKEGDVVELRIARARSIEDGARFLFRLHGVDLGETTQGHPLAGVYAEAVEDTEDTSAAMQYGLERGKQLAAIAGFGSGIHDLKLIVEAMHSEGLLPNVKGSRKPSAGAAYIQQFFHQLITEGGSNYGDYIIRMKKNGPKLEAIQVLGVTH